MPSIGWIHTLTAVAALVSGLLVLLTRKGTRRHRQLGWVYVASMLSLNLTALLIYRLFGGFGPFHVAAILSLATVLAGTVAAVRARRARVAGDCVARARAMGHHYHWMTWSYVGLLAAAISEIATRLPALRPQPGHDAVIGLTVVAATLLVVGVGRRLIRERQLALLQPYQRAAGSP